MANDANPSFVKINYHSAAAPHTMEIPALTWNDVASTGGAGEFDIWSGGTIDADSMINDLTDVIAALLPDTATIDGYTIYTYGTPRGAPQPRVSKAIGTAGLDATPGWWQAVQVTQTFRTTDFNLMKLNILDSATNNDFSKTLSIPPGGALEDIFTLLSSNVQGWCGRDAQQVAAFVSQTIDLNDALRRRYRLA